MEQNRVQVEDTYTVLIMRAVSTGQFDIHIVNSRSPRISISDPAIQYADSFMYENINVMDLQLMFKPWQLTPVLRLATRTSMDGS